MRYRIGCFMWRWVLDTSVLVAGLRSRQGASYVLLGLVADRIIRPLATPALFLEYEDVLKRPEHLLAMRISLADVDHYLNGFADAVEPVEVYYHWRPQLPDPDDELVFEAAINGGATALITHNIRDFFTNRSVVRDRGAAPTRRARGDQRTSTADVSGETSCLAQAGSRAPRQGRNVLRSSALHR